MVVAPVKVGKYRDDDMEEFGTMQNRVDQIVWELFNDWMRRYTLWNEEEGVTAEQNGKNASFLFFLEAGAGSS